MSDLTDFLLARIAEDEAVARAAQRNVEAVPAGATIFHRADLEHIARWDPARVLAECAAKRRIMELHAISVTTEWVNPSDGPAYQEPERTCAICGWVPDACGTVKSLSLPFADHPDYDPSWRP